jgi:hypothetical protein
VHKWGWRSARNQRHRMYGVKIQMHRMKNEEQITNKSGKDVAVTQPNVGCDVIYKCGG